MIPTWAFLFVTLVFQTFEYVQAEDPAIIQLRENYILHATVFLENVPTEVEYYRVSSKMDGGSPQTGSPYKPIYITNQLQGNNFRIYIELKKKNNNVCATRIVIEGSAGSFKERLNSGTKCTEYYYRDKYYHRNCKITIDFGNKCDDPEPAGMKCKLQNSFLTCEAVLYDNPERPTDLTHFWYQNVLNLKIPNVVAENTKYKMEVFQFDVNTTIKSKMTSEYWEDELVTQTYTISWTPSHNFRDPQKIYYSESDPVQFRCNKQDGGLYNVQIGMILPLPYENKLTILQDNEINTTDFHNGTILFCVYYTITGNHELKIVQRHVSSQSILIRYNRSPSKTYIGTPFDSYQPQQNRVENYPNLPNEHNINNVDSTSISWAWSSTNRPTTAKPKPPATAKPTPPTTAKPTPSATAKPTPPTTAKPEPPATAKPTPPTTAKPTPPTTAKPTPPTTAKPTPPATAKPIPPTTAKLTPPTTAKPTPPTTAKPTPPTTAKPTPPTTAKPTTRRTAKSTLPTTTESIHIQKRVDKLIHNHLIETENASVSPKTDKSKYYFVTGAVGIIILLILVVYLVYKKCHRKSPKQEKERELELETYATCGVLYADLRLNPANNSRQVEVNRNNEETYAQIIGVLKPPDYKVEKF